LPCLPSPAHEGFSANAVPLAEKMLATQAAIKKLWFFMTFSVYLVNVGDTCVLRGF
jgi:hypothetical protein